MIIRICIFAFVILCLPYSGKGLALDRIALIIGSAYYPDAPLRNPANDAKAMAKRLEDLGHELYRLLVLTHLDSV